MPLQIASSAGALSACSSASDVFPYVTALVQCRSRMGLRTRVVQGTGDEPRHVGEVPDVARAQAPQDAQHLQIALALEEHRSHEQLEKGRGVPTPQRGWLERELTKPLLAAEHGQRAGVFRCRVVRLEVP